MADLSNATENVSHNTSSTCCLVIDRGLLVSALDCKLPEGRDPVCLEQCPAYVTENAQATLVEKRMKGERK